MSDCETNELALERRAGGGLSEEEVLALETHLASCSECRRYSRLMERMEAVITDSNATVDSKRTWPRVNKYVLRREEKANRVLRRYVPIVIGLGGFGLVIDLIEGSNRAAFFSALLILCGLIQLVIQMSRQRSLLKMAESPDDILTLFRRELGFRRLLARMGVFVALVFGLVWIGTSLESPPAWMPTIGFGRGSVGSFGIGAALLAFALYVMFVVLPRQRRERTELE